MCAKLLVVAIVAALGVPFTALAQDNPEPTPTEETTAPAPAPDSAGASDTEDDANAPSPEGENGDASETAGNASEEADGPVPAPEKDLKEQLKEAREKYDELKDASPTEKKLAIAAFIAVLLNLLLTGLKKVMKFTKKGKKYLPWIALSLGVVIVMVEKFALGGSWVEAIIYGGAGPGAVLVQELLGLFKKDSEEKTAEA